ncbi:MAG: hypothetical protein R2748_25395 [Bryobacterales bacterium]
MHSGIRHAYEPGVIHPFAHMNSNYAAAQVRARVASSAAAEPFHAVLSRAPEDDFVLDADAGSSGSGDVTDDTASPVADSETASPVETSSQGAPVETTPAESTSPGETDPSAAGPLAHRAD